MLKFTRSRFTVLTALVALALLGVPAMAQDLATVDVSASGLSFSSLDPGQGLELSVGAPDGVVHHYHFAAGEMPVFRLGDGTFPDGNYRYELHLVAAPRSRTAGGPVQTASNVSQSGSFSVLGGTIVTGGTEARTPKAAPLVKDQVILDDLIVDGSACIGQDCVNGESFGFDTLRLKENNLRIKFQDTSNSASFPTNDWQITANDSSNGGANKFSIDDIDGGRTPFTIEASAPSNSLFVDDSGRIGIGTSVPVVNLQVVTGNTPTLRLEQNGSAGFAAQTWDVAGNEANFFVRDVTNGSTLPFRIRPGAPSSAIDVAASGNVGIGASSPSAALHVRRTDGSAAVQVEEASGTNADRELLKLINNGTTRLSLDATSAGGTTNNWRITSANNGDFTVNSEGDSNTQFRIDQTGRLRVNTPTGGSTAFDLLSNGDLTILGALTQNSDRNAKTDFEPVDASALLEKLSALPIREWRYKDNPENVRHIGPMAQDFFAAFGLNGTETGISSLDTSGVAIAAIQALNAELEEKDSQIDQLENHNSELEARLATLEALVRSIAEAGNH